MAQAITRHWRDQLCPNRHYRLLALKEDLQNAVDEETIHDDDEPPDDITDKVGNASEQHQAGFHREPSVLPPGDVATPDFGAAQHQAGFP